MLRVDRCFCQSINQSTFLHGPLYKIEQHLSQMLNNREICNKYQKKKKAQKGKVDEWMLKSNRNEDKTLPCNISSAKHANLKVWYLAACRSDTLKSRQHPQLLHRKDDVLASCYFSSRVSYSWKFTASVADGGIVRTGYQTGNMVVSGFCFSGHLQYCSKKNPTGSDSAHSWLAVSWQIS